MKKVLSLLFALCVSTWVLGQEKCGSHHYEQELRAKYPQQMGTKEQFEQWMAGNIEARKARVASGQRVAPYTVPVIIHVIYNNANFTIQNNSVNIPYGQAKSQIDVLTADYRKLNADFLTTVLPVFQSKAGAMDITFVPATKDPNGNFLTEPGVERINGEARFSSADWSQGTANSTLKPQTIWDPAQYFNIWVVKFSGSSDTGLFGYAQFPSMTPGWGTSGGANTTDGVVINWRATGSNYNVVTGAPLATPYVSAANLICDNCDSGRTLTHEVGHWLGLRHIWGDQGGCAGPNNDDYCQDTPEHTGANNPTTGCPVRPNSCTNLEPSYGNTDTPDQRENYMDYSSDGCMGMFSLDQVARMESVMDIAPNRASLNTPGNVAGVAPTRPNGLYVSILSNKTSDAEGSPFTFQQVSQAQSVPNITTYTWNFNTTGTSPAPIPATFTGATPPTVTFGAGTYQVALTVSNGTNTATSNVITINTTLKSPSSLQFTNRTGNPSKVIDFAVLQWVDNSTSEDGYYVERKRSSEPVSAFTKISGVTNLPPNTTTYTDTYSSTNSIVSGTTYNYRVSAVKGIGTASVTGSIIAEISIPTALEDMFSRSVLVYPNPAQNSFSVDLKGIQVNKAEILLYNSLGQVIAERKISDTNTVDFDINTLPKGVYVLKIKTDQGTAIKRLVFN